MSSYFGVVTCEGCSQKVSLAPEKVKVEDGQNKYECRRCMKFFVLPGDFEFKHPTKKNLPTDEALKAIGSGHQQGLFSKLLSIFRR